MSTTENDVVKGIRSEYQYGFSNPDEEIGRASCRERVLQVV